MRDITDKALKHVGKVIENIDRRVDIGNFYIAPGYRKNKVWIGRQDGEGGDFDIEAVEKVIEKFYEENF